MQPPVWTPAVELSPAEQQSIKRIKRAKLFVFLRQYCQTLFDDAFQQELASMYIRMYPKDSRPLHRPSWRWQPFCKPALCNSRTARARIPTLMIATIGCAHELSGQKMVNPPTRYGMVELSVTTTPPGGGQ